MVAEHTSILLHRAKRGQPERVNQVNHRIHPGKRRSRNHMAGLSSLRHGSGGVTAYRTASAIRRARRRPPRRLTCRCIPQALPPAPHDSTERGLPESSRYPTSLHPSGGAKNSNPSTVPVQWGRFGKGLGRHAHGALDKSFVKSRNEETPWTPPVGWQPPRSWTPSKSTVPLSRI